MKIAVASGKGGTGKTSLVGAFAALAERPVLADCDVDAADLPLLLDPSIGERHDFFGGKKAQIDTEQCRRCRRCQKVCRFGAVRVTMPRSSSDPPTVGIDPIACEGCGVCAWVCPSQAIRTEEAKSGEWFVSETQFGPRVHAKLGVAEENSGKLITTVRGKAREMAEANGQAVLLVDSSPGIGCPVIASITGADLVLIVTESTVAGEHDLERVADLAKHFGLPAAIAIHKADIHPEMAERIRNRAAERGLVLVGTIPYDKRVTDAQVAKKTIVEYADGAFVARIRELWQRLYALTT